MEWLNEKWDRVILTIVALVAIAVGAIFVRKAMGYTEQFEIPSSVPDTEIPVGEVPRVERATNFATNEFKWSLPVRGEGEAKKSLPLFISIPIVEVGGELIDMLDPSARQVRSPVSNKWLLDNGLDFLKANVLDQDPDQDGFSNREEWEAQSGPRDVKDHPAYGGKINLEGRFSQDYKIEFSAHPDDKTFFLTRHPTGNFPRASFNMKLEQTSDDKKFRLDGYKENSGKNALGVTVDTSEITITWLETGEQKKLTRRVPETIQTLFAKLKFQLSNQPVWEDFVQEGKEFKLTIDPETVYTLEKVTPEEATVTYQRAPGQTETLKIVPKS